MTKKHSSHKLALSITASILAACGAQAHDLNLGTNLPPVDFHGFVSQGYLYSSSYNYLAPNSTGGTADFFELGLNGSFNPFPRTRIAVQGFEFDVGDIGKYQPLLDYALAEYTFSDSIGIRAGRIRRPQGIYNHIQDVDLARTYVLLPQSVYDCRYRDFSTSIDGGEIFGNFGLGSAGDVSYEAFAGMINISKTGGVAKQLANAFYPAPASLAYLVDIPSAPFFGVQLWYNTPVSGLRVGVSEGYVPGFENDVYISPLIGGPGLMQVKSDTFSHQYSVEYILKSLTLQAEYQLNNTTSHNYVAGHDVGHSTSLSDGWYLGASYRLVKWAEVGGYYSESYSDDHDRNNSLKYQKDLALSLRFDPTDWWIFKVEGHYIHGTGLLQDTANNPVQNDNGWFMLAVKTTFSF